MDQRIDILENQRLRLQTELDSGKTQAERNRLGQFATPTALAVDILTYAATLLSVDEKIRFLDPAIGTGAFYSALRTVFPNSTSLKPSVSRSTPTTKNPLRDCGRSRFL